MVLVEHGNEPCRYRQLYKLVNESSGRVEGDGALASMMLKKMRRPKVTTKSVSFTLRHRPVVTHLDVLV